MRLDRRGFAKWLRDQPPDDIAGEPFKASRCPLALYTDSCIHVGEVYRHPLTSEGHCSGPLRKKRVLLSVWAVDFANRVDDWASEDATDAWERDRITVLQASDILAKVA